MDSPTQFINLKGPGSLLFLKDLKYAYQQTPGWAQSTGYPSGEDVYTISTNIIRQQVICQDDHFNLFYCIAMYLII